MLAGIACFGAVVGLLVLFDLAALAWGVDSRPGMPDDRRR